MNLLRKQSRFVLTVFGDTHGGNKLGLMHPDTLLLDPSGKEYSPQLNESQRYLNEVHSKHVEKVKEFADGDDLYVLHLGDSTQGDKYPVETFSSRMADQFQISRYNFKYWYNYKHLKAIRIAVGTPAHNFGEMAAEETVAEYVRKDKPNLDVAITYHGLLCLKGIYYDYAHRGPPGGKRNWLHGNEARYYLRSLMMDELQAGNPPPDMVFRGHYHTFVEEYLSIPFMGKRYKSWIYTLPSYCMLGEYGVGATSSQFYITNGMIATEVVDGQVGKTIILEQTLDIRTKEEIQ